MRLCERGEGVGVLFNLHFSHRLTAASAVTAVQPRDLFFCVKTELENGCASCRVLPYIPRLLFPSENSVLSTASCGVLTITHADSSK